ncbi:MAG: glycosyltransferase, exosortase A system-associated [Magnetococcales bacterium]|nr:glycosyltransferase, exosortase A system-associated [Magnetococcales bacterium]
MDILHVLDHSLPLQSGYTFRTRSILLQQHKLGFKTQQVTGLRHACGGVEKEVVSGLNFYRTKSATGFFSKVPVIQQWVAIKALQARIEELVASKKPDIIHAHSPALNGVAAVLAARRFGIPVVYEIRAFWEDAAVSHGTSRSWGPRYLLTRWLESWVIKQAQAVTTICAGLRQEIIGRGTSPNKITIIPNAVDFKNFSSPPALPDNFAQKVGVAGKKVLGFIGSFYGYEGLELLILAMVKICQERKDVVLLLVGGGAEEAKLKAQVQELNLAKNIIFTGRVEHEQVPLYYQLVDIFIYPRLAIRLTDLVTPLKPLEAMASSKLVLASDVGGHKELIQDGKTGYLFTAGSKDDLAAKVLQLLSNETDWPTIHKQAQSYVKEERNWQKSVANYVSVYQQVIAKIR